MPPHQLQNKRIHPATTVLTISGTSPFESLFTLPLGIAGAKNLSYRMNNRTDKNFQVLISTMRSGSSLCGHLLAEAGWIWYAGETQIRLDNEKGLRAACEKILQNGGGTRKDAPLCDKVLAPRLLPDRGRFLMQRAELVYLLIRHPLAIWRSGKQKNWDFFQLEDLYQQLLQLREMVEFLPREKLRVLSYYDLTSSKERKRVFGKDINFYAHTPHTGKAGWGGAGELIRSGKIHELSLEDDLRRALKEVWMDLANTHLLQAMNEYRAILKWVCREDLEVPLPEEVFDGIKGLRIENGKGNGSEFLTLSIKDIKEQGELLIGDRMLEWIWSENLAHSCHPNELERLLKEFHRVLLPGGTLRLSTVDFDFVIGLSNETEKNYQRWYREKYLSENIIGNNPLSIVNHLFRKRGYDFLYNRETLTELMKAAGFFEVSETLLDEREAGIETPNDSRSKGHFVLEGKK